MSGTLQATILKDGASSTNNLTFDSSGNATVGNNLTVTGGLVPSSSFMRNRIINGNMTIDQRWGGAAVTIPAATFTYTVDRWLAYGTAASKYTCQQTPSATETGYATRVGAGFTNYLAMTSLAATSPAATDIYIVGQKVEGFNIADLAWGTSSAKTVTLSFWVNSSLTGTFGGSLLNTSGSRCYVFSYTISAANTWEQKTITVAGDTTGTWVTNNGIGIQMYFDIGSGTTEKGTAGSWGSTLYYGVTGGTNVISTNGATFYITGVQLEVGSSATPFERRLYGTELELCQRYLPVLNANSAVSGYATSTTLALIAVPFGVTSRVAPTGITTPSFSGSLYNSAGSALSVTATSFVAGGTSSGFINASVASGLTAGNGTLLYSTAIQFTGCEL